MTKINNKNKEHIKKQILQKMSFEWEWTYNIANKLARDDEFIKRLLEELEQEGFVVSKRYKSRIKWRYF